MCGKKLSHENLYKILYNGEVQSEEDGIAQENIAVASENEETVDEVIGTDASEVVKSEVERPVTETYKPRKPVETKPNRSEQIEVSELESKASEIARIDSQALIKEILGNG